MSKQWLYDSSTTPCHGTKNKIVLDFFARVAREGTMSLSCFGFFSYTEGWCLHQRWELTSGYVSHVQYQAALKMVMLIGSHGDSHSGDMQHDNPNGTSRSWSSAFRTRGNWSPLTWFPTSSAGFPPFCCQLQSIGANFKIRRSATEISVLGPWNWPKKQIFWSEKTPCKDDPKKSQRRSHRCTNMEFLKDMMIWSTKIQQFYHVNPTIPFWCILNHFESQ